MSLFTAVVPGLKGVKEIVVADEHTAPHVGSGKVPVLATPVVVNLLEAAALASTVDVPLLVSHVVEPLRFPSPPGVRRPNVDAERRTRAEDALERLVKGLRMPVKAEALTAFGDPAEEIAKIARDRRVGLVVIGLHGSPVAGPRMGSVTYRVLCLAQVPVLALPPAVAEAKALQSIPLTTQAGEPMAAGSV